MKILCIYHSRDLDGWCSAAIVLHWFKQIYKKGLIKNLDSSETAEIFNKTEEEISNNDPELYFKGWDYGQYVPWNEIKDGSLNRLILCDISFDKDAMNNLFEQFGEEFIWIDHHASSLKENDIELITGIQNSTKAACQHTWDFFFPGTKMPEFVWYLGMYDSFSHKDTEYEEKVLIYQYAARSLIDDYEEAYWYLTRWDDKSLTSSMLQLGEGIYGYLKKEAKQIYAKAFPIELDGYKFLAVNRERFNPVNFGIDYHKDGYDGFACFWWDGSKWVWSLYSDNGKTDVSEIAKKRGGGGHFGASGFTQNKLDPLNYKIDNK
jgi:oligoribonuclease NrnB/cAMP/cGMP phosphodiesterase (DHH superfamily)